MSFLGLFGGDTEASTSSQQTTTTETANQNLQDVPGQALAVAGDVGSVTFTDENAIQQATDLASGAVDRVLDFGRSALDSSTGAVQDAYGKSIAELSGTSDKAIASVLSATRSDTADTLNTLTKWLTGAVALVAIAFVITQYGNKA